MSKHDTPITSAMEAAITGLQRQVGDRVRRARAEARISRRILSERSGVSPRYLAQLEAGEGNISIGLLLRVSNALDTPMAALIGDAGPEALRIGLRYENADTAIQSRVRALLEQPQKAGRICLIGLRGAGKSSLGAAVAKKLDLPFVELNRCIEAEGGMPVGEIIALYGNDGYRKFEADALAGIEAQYSRAVVAVSGGIVGAPDHFERLLSRFHTIWLKATPQEHMARVQAQGDTRPMDGNPQAMAQLRRLLETREADYARADTVLDTSGIDFDTALAALLDLIDQHGFASAADTTGDTPP